MTTETTTAEVKTSEDKGRQFVPKNAQVGRILGLIEFGTVETLSYDEKDWIASQFGRFQKSLNIDDTAELSFGKPKGNGTFDCVVKGKALSLAANSVGFIASLCQWENSARKFVKETLGDLPSGEKKWFGSLTVPIPKPFRIALEMRREKKS